MENYKRVLLVDDDEISNTINKVLIKHSRFASDVVSISDPKKAIEFLYKEDTDLPEVIFLDLEMPAMDGWEFVTEFKKLNKEKQIKIVLLTASVFKSDQQKAAGFSEISAFVSKPLSPQLLQSIEEIKLTSDQTLTASHQGF